MGKMTQKVQVQLPRWIHCERRTNSHSDTCAHAHTQTHSYINVMKDKEGQKAERPVCDHSSEIPCRVCGKFARTEKLLGLS